MRTSASTHRGSRGFSLVEVAVAMLVVSIGILAAFGLFPSGLQAGAASMDETRAVLFAEETFNSLRALAASPDVSWNDLLRNHTHPAVVVPAWHGNWMWNDPDNDLAPRVTGGDIRTNLYQSSRMSSRFAGTLPDSPNLEEFALRYRLRAEAPPPGLLLKLSLWVWPGEFGPTSDAEAHFFYTEIFNLEGPDTDPNAGPEVAP